MSLSNRYTSIDSPLGPLLVARDEIGITTVWLPTGRHAVGPDGPRQPDGPDALPPGWRRDDAGFDDVRAQLEEYFTGGRTHFDLPLHMIGSAFQQTVWAALRDIPYGETRSYGKLAATIGMPSSARAVGLANGRNPVSIVVPCHRVIGADGSLTGYGGGLDAKRWLLTHETAQAGLFAL